MNKPALKNKLNRKELLARLKSETFKRMTLSFYRYVILNDPNQTRDHLFRNFQEMNVLGRVYVAREGINAQINIPENNFDKLRSFLDENEQFKNIPFKVALEEDGFSFLKLVIKVRGRIVADGLADDAYDVTNTGKRLSAKDFNTAMETPGTLVVDMRNHYESEVGHFENSLLPDAGTFKEALPEVLDMLAGKSENKILLYCTGGIRCEKASAFLRHHGFKDVNQLSGGIIAYAHEVKSSDLKNKFLGKNFVFDGRMGERIGDQVISHCHQCGKISDRHVNCSNDDCHLLFIQCESCSAKHSGCCTPECLELIQLPLEEQLRLRKGQAKTDTHKVFKSRLRPKLSGFS